LSKAGKKIRHVPLVPYNNHCQELKKIVNQCSLVNSQRKFGKFAVFSVVAHFYSQMLAC
jgi:hypothetical protein